MTRPKWKPYPGSLVRVTDDPAVWRVVAVADGVAHLTKVLAFDRIDWKGVPVARLAPAASVLA